ncbi:MAG TPA: hypothetical protein VEA92_03485 [Candidatus Paceibacterota bacterium]|nr:hypothetical protein [Candidatus Paceibacterota bacterium]
MTSTPSGFTLVETLVAVLLLTMTIILPYYAIQRSLTATFSARDDLIASALAQEAVEYVRGVRDNNYLAGRTGASWLYGLDGGTGERNCISAPCSVDVTRGSEVNLAVQQCNGNPPSGQPPCYERPLYLSSSNLFYTHVVTGTKTPYVRYIRIEPVAGSGNNAVKITATVTWVYRGTHNVTVTDVLTNWI